MLERLRTREVAIDTLLAVGFFVLGLMTRAAYTDLGLGPFERGPDLLNTFLIAAYTLPLALRRVFPVTVFGIVAAALLADTGLDYPQTLARGGVLLAIHALGTELPPRRSLRIGGTAGAAITGWTAIGAAVYESVPASAILTQAIFVAVPLYLGREVYRRRARMEELQRRAEQAERDREEQARRAVAEERTRIARELHDVVAHQVTVMTIQADGAARLARDADPRVGSALETIKETGQHALAEMRRVVGLLRTASDDDDLAPQPQMADLDALVARVGDAGLPVEVELEGDLGGLAEGVQLSAYRVIQESLTNAVRHGGPGTSARVRVACHDRQLEVVVEDDGRGAAAEAGRAGGGNGLVGMRERVAVLGGSLEAGPRQGGGFRVHATLPTDA